MKVMFGIMAFGRFYVMFKLELILLFVLMRTNRTHRGFAKVITLTGQGHLVASAY